MRYELLSSQCCEFIVFLACGSQKLQRLAPILRNFIIRWGVIFLFGAREP